MKCYAQIYLQLSNLQYDKIPLKRCEKPCFFARFSQRFNPDGLGPRLAPNTSPMSIGIPVKVELSPYYGELGFEGLPPAAQVGSLLGHGYP